MSGTSARQKSTPLNRPDDARVQSLIAADDPHISSLISAALTANDPHILSLIAANDPHINSLIAANDPHILALIAANDGHINSLITTALNARRFVIYYTGAAWPARTVPTGYSGIVDWDSQGYTSVAAPSAALDGDRWIGETI